MDSITALTALVAGLLSFFSPCVLPLVPIYLGYMTGRTVKSFDRSSRWPTMAHAAFFVLGFGLLFVALGAAAGLLGQLLYSAMPTITRVGGLLLIVFGLHMTGLLSIPLLNMDKRVELRTGSRSLWTSFVVGVVFAAGWTPCVGPVLSGILLLAADSQTAGRGAALLALYALGLGLPFLGVAALVDAALPALHKLNRYARVASIVGGLLLVVMGLLLMTGLFDQLIFRLNSLG